MAEDDRVRAGDNETRLMSPPRDGEAVSDAKVLRETIGDFEILAKLGAGGMGAVYRAQQISLGRMVALKVLPPQFVADADSVARFHREACVAASLNHANLVKVYVAGEADGCHYIAMELIEGEDLSARLRREGSLPAPEALRICAEAAHGLQYGWQSAQLIHRDIKPGNIFLTEEGAVKLGDLGLAKSTLANAGGLTQPGTMMGTPHYISPEQARADREIDFRADIYSLGCTLYHMLTGHVPYGGSGPLTVMNQHVHAPLPAILKVWPQCPVPLARLVSRMLKKARHERHASYTELIAQIESAWAQIDPLSFNPEAFAPPSQAPSPALSAVPPPPVVPAVTTAHRSGRALATLSTRPPPKLKLPLYGCLVVAVLGGVFFFGPRGEKRPAPQKKARGIVTSAESVSKIATLATATRDAPFTNSRGMKFVPVPIVGGVTGGKRVLFSIWETRVQDYGPFIKEAQRGWPRPGFEQAPDHPAVGVSWEDAKAFCAWLTARERQEGKLQADAIYRLPTDHEWSCAAGIGELEDAAKHPEAKSQKVGNIFPWGLAWPPPKGAGNFWSEELRPLLAAGRHNWIKGELPGYHDGFATTAPAGSFAANRSRLYDLGGNVWEWVEDWSDETAEFRVLRGSSWNTCGRGTLLASRRSRGAPTVRNGGNGFRCVLGPAVLDE